MARVTSEELERLRVKKEQLEAKLKRLQHQQRYQNRKDETRRKIIMGASIGAAVRDGVVSSKLLAYVLNRYVTKKNEREFMGLEPREETSSQVPTDQAVSTEKDAERDHDSSSYEEGRDYFTDEELEQMDVVKSEREDE